MEKDYVILLENVSKQYRLYKQKKDRAKEALHPFGKKFHKDFYAVKDLDLKVKKGEILGIIGRNGSGKSTLLKLIAGVITPTGGTVKTRGNVVPLLELGSGLNPEYSGLENIYFYSSILGFTRKEAEKRIKDIIDFADIGDFIYQPLKTYSSGMKARLAFAVSVNIDPDILILDEVLAVGDELFRRKSFAKMEEFFKAGKTILYVSHSINSINQLCTRAILLDNGEIILEGPPKLVTMHYQKYIYLKNEERNKIRKELLELNIYEEKKDDFITRCETANSEENEEDKRENVIVFEQTERKEEAKVKSGAYFVPNFIPKSTVHIKNEDVEIYDIDLQTLQMEKVNALIIDEEYMFSYKVRFNINKKNVFFGMAFKSKKGLHISNMDLLRIGKTIDVSKNEEYRIDVKFRCRLLMGTYYINIGVNCITNNGVHVLHSILDAYVFKVQDENKYFYGALVHLDQKMKLIKL